VAQVPIGVKLIERLLQRYPGTVVGIKDSSGDWSNTRAMLDTFPGFEVFAGSEEFLLANMRGGGVGCISATANINPAAIHRLYAGWRDHDADSAQGRLTELRRAVQKYPMIPALKAVIAQHLGDKDWAVVRPPLVALTEEQQVKLNASLDWIGFNMPGIKG
jgi:4-hydroxy-tetrahydrodipicolinate synthase